MRKILGIFKDKASIIRATLTIRRTSSSINIAILRATSQTSTSPPPEHRVATILALGHGTRPVACACIQAIIDRLHNTHSPYVALKCLIILQNIITNGSFILKDQLSFYPLSGGHNSLKLSRFLNKTNVETWEFSLWVRWYASILEHNLITSRVLGCYFSSSSYFKFDKEKDKDSMSRSMELDLLGEMDSLVSMVEGISSAPESLQYQKNDLVHEAMLLVSEDYRCTQYQIMRRVEEFGNRVSQLSSDDSSALIFCLKRLEVCRKRLTEMFANRNRNDAFWELINQTKTELEKLNEERERGRLVVWKGNREGSEQPTRFGERVTGTSRAITLLPRGSQVQGLVVDRVQLTV